MAGTRTRWARTTGALVLPWFVVVAAAALAIPGAAAGAASTAPSWSASNFNPSVGNDNAVSCFSSTQCVIGAESAILGTTDGGETWQGQNLPDVLTLQPLDFEAVSCPSATKCEAVGVDVETSASIAFGTENGGASWQEQTVPAEDEQLTSISCPTVKVCLATGLGDSALRTTDGGVQWSVETLPVSNVTQVACMTSMSCVAVGALDGGNILETTNGGATWSSVSLLFEGFLFSYDAVSCPTAEVCEAVGGPPASARTTNGGVTWSMQGESTPTGPDVSDMSCATTSHCTAVGLSGILATTNGGVTWKNQTLPSTFTDFTPSGVSCPKSTTSCDVVSDVSGQIAATTDGGAVWSLQQMNDQTVPSSASCASATACVAVGGGNSADVIQSSDGGALWSFEGVPSGTWEPNDELSSVSCPTAAACELVGDEEVDNSPVPVLMRSVNGGQTWSAQVLPSAITSPLDITCPSTSVCELSGLGSGGTTVLASSQNGGATWSTQATSLSYANGVLPIRCASIKVCEVASAGTTPILLKTSNGGVTWTQQKLPTNFSLLSTPSCASAAICDAVVRLTSGGYRTIRTTNGGTSWTVQATISGVSSLSDLACSTTTTCELAGRDSSGDWLILGTATGGSAWQLQTSFSPSSALLPIACRANGICSIAGIGPNGGGLLAWYR